MGISEKLKELAAPIEMQDWATGKSFREVWETCDRGDWLIAVLAASPLDGKVLTSAAIDCAEPCFSYVKGSTYSLRNAINCAKNWALGMAGVPILSLAIQQAGEEEAAVANSAELMSNPVTRQISMFARYALLAAAHSAIARSDAQNAVYAAHSCCEGGAEQLTTLAISAKRIRDRVGFEAAKAALGQ